MRRTGFGIGIATECRAEALPGRNRFGDPEVFTLAKEQMLKQVSITKLAVAFIKRACVDPHPDRNLPGRHTIFSHTIPQPVGKLAKLPFFVARNVAVFINPGRLTF